MAYIVDLASSNLRREQFEYRHDRARGLGKRVRLEGVLDLRQKIGLAAMLGARCTGSPLLVIRAPQQGRQLRGEIGGFGWL